MNGKSGHFDNRSIKIFFLYPNTLNWTCFMFSSPGNWLKAILISKWPSGWFVIGLKRLHVSGFVLIRQFHRNSRHRHNATLPHKNVGSNCLHPHSLCSTGNSYFQCHLALQGRLSLEVECMKLTQRNDHWYLRGTTKFREKQNWTTSIIMDPTS